MSGSDDRVDRIRVISLNCWGLKYISKFRNQRLKEIGIRIAAANPLPDIVGLQECWTQEDFEAICQSTSHFLPYSKFYYSGAFGSGLAILSRWPIESSSIYQYPLNGRPTAFFRGDWFVGKGVASASIRLGPRSDDVVDVFCTHLHAPYEREPNDSYICHRTAQAWEIAKLMRSAGERGHLVLGVGDFNMIPLSLAHRLIEAHGAVQDIWRIVHPDSSIGAAVDAAEQKRQRPMPSARFNVERNGTTCDSAFNTWRWNKAHQKQLNKGQDILVPDDTPDAGGKRLDYIFVGTNSAKELADSWHVEEVHVGMLQRHPTLLCSLSDHFSVETTIVRGSDAVSLDTKSRRIDASPSYTSLETYDEILAMIAQYDARERRQRRLRIAHFLIAFWVSIGCLVAVWWSPRNFVAFILMLISTLGLTAGSVDGLIGLLFMSSEIRALKEFRWEIANAKKRASLI